MKHYIILTLLLFAAGCSGGIKISGTVTYEEDGSPVKHGSVVFGDAQNTYQGLIKDGKYVSGNKQPNRGIPAGQYKVWLLNADDVDWKPNADNTDKVRVYTQNVAPEYTSSSTTPLTFEVKSSGAKTFDIKVKRAENSVR
ncbi:MAG: hypothetical protein LBT46_09445 [Planctomycetaceae bacterium]|jgi:hypothetical protein|nr:hypothetical protein [Planctomycetaceae bacterium]